MDYGIFIRRFDIPARHRHRAFFSSLTADTADTADIL